MYAGGTLSVHIRTVHNIKGARGTDGVTLYLIQHNAIKKEAKVFQINANISCGPNRYMIFNILD